MEMSFLRTLDFINSSQGLTLRHGIQFLLFFPMYVYILCLKTDAFIHATRYCTNVNISLNNCIIIVEGEGGQATEVMTEPRFTLARNDSFFAFIFMFVCDT